jgi:hypothetical protein
VRNDPRVTLYTRSDCGLCDEALDGLRAMLEAGARFELVEVDIESDDRVFAAFLERIPVVELEGEVICELWLDRDALLARLDTVSEMGPDRQRAAER